MTTTTTPVVTYVVDPAGPIPFVVRADKLQQYIPFYRTGRRHKECLN